MQWCGGGIAEAVTLSRNNNSIFVVYIEGADDVSKQFTEAIDKPEVAEVLGSKHFVAIKVVADSVPHQQFSEIYKQTPIPSLYFIGKTGTPIEIVTEANDSKELAGKVNNILVKAGVKQPDVAAQQLIKEESAPEECEGDVCSIQQTPATSKEEIKEELKATTGLSNEEKLRLAQELIEKQRVEKKVEEEEKERMKEIERRKLGQDVQKMKRWQQDQEIKQMMEERDRERREEQEARDKVRRQIEEDKREKAARLAGPAAPAPVEQQPRSVRPQANTARLQLKFPDGSTNTHDFSSSSILQDVIDYIKSSNLNVNFANFVLSTTFPRREFGASDYTNTLLDLELVPNAVILVLPVARGAVTTNTNDGFIGMIWFVLTPILSLLGYIKGFIVGKPNSTPPVQKRSATVDPAEGPSRPMPKKRAGEAAIKRQGNIHRLTDRDSDDDNNTWNGNSTQQM